MICFCTFYLFIDFLGGEGLGGGGRGVQLSFCPPAREPISIIPASFLVFLSNFGIFVIIKLIPFDKIFENSAGAIRLLAKRSNGCSY